MAISEELKLVVKAEVTDAIKNLNKLNKEASTTKNVGDSITKGFKDFGKSLLMAGGAIFALDKLGKGFSEIIKMAKTASNFNQIQMSFRNMARVAGESADAVIASLQEMSGHTINELDLMTAASKASLLGLPVDKFDELMQIARASATATGGDVKQMFADIVTGIGRASPMILDNLGITIKIGEANQKYADSIGKTVEQMSAEDKKMAILNATLESGRKIMEQVGEAGQNLTDAEIWQQLTAGVDDLKIALGQTMMEGIKPFVKWLADVSMAAAASAKEINAINKALKEFQEGKEISDIDAGIKAINNEIKEMEIAIEAFSNSGATAVGIVEGMRFATEETLKADEARVEQMKTELAILKQRKVSAAAQLVYDKAASEEVRARAAIELQAAEEKLAAMKKMDTQFAQSHEGQVAAAYAEWQWFQKNLEALEKMGTVTERAIINARDTKAVYDELIKSTDKVDDSLQRINDIYMRMGDTTDYTDYGLAAIKEANAELVKVKENLQVNADFMTGPLTDAYLALSEGFGTLVNHHIDGIEMVKRVFKDMIIAMLKGLAQVMLVQGAAMMLLNPAGGVAMIAAAAAAQAGAGAISQLAKGGIVTQPTLAMVGEKGPEAVIPLNKGGGVGQTIIYNIRGSLITEKEVSKRITKRQAQFNRGF